MVIAPEGQTFTHFMQAMQPFLQFSMTGFPFSGFAHEILAADPAGISMMSPFGQADMHFRQSTQFGS